MSDYYATTVGLSGWVGHLAQPLRATLAPLREGVSRAGFHWLRRADFSGTVRSNNRVMVKADAETPEQPMPGARVRLHRLQDGYLAWQGIADAAGYYHASGLEPGIYYVPVAIDLSGTYECVASGPVLAERTDA